MFILDKNDIIFEMRHRYGISKLQKWWVVLPISQTVIGACLISELMKSWRYSELKFGGGDSQVNEVAV
jgi:hypothetical protein